MTETACVREARAEVFSVGGAFILMVCVVLTVISVMATRSSNLTGPQALIAVILTVAAWAYYLSSVTERLALTDHAIVYTSLLARDRRIPITDLESMLLVHQGFNLERGIETIEFRRRLPVGRQAAPDRIALGPCWHRHTLEAFLHSVEEALNEPKLLEEVR